MMRRTSLVSAVVLLGCGGAPDAHEPSATIAIESSQPAGEPVAAPLRAIPAEETALEVCLAPIDPSVFSKLGARSEKPRKGKSPRRRPLPVEPAGPCGPPSPADECAYQEARTHFEERRFDLAARGFRKLAFDGEVNDIALFAAQLALESLNMLGTYADPPRSECFDVIGSDIDKLLDRYCRGPHIPERDDACSTFFRIAQDLRRLRTEELIKTADAAPDQSRPLYEKAGDEYRAMFDEACAPTEKEGRGRRTRCDELLFNAHRAYRAAGARAKMEATYRTFVDPRFGLEKSPLAEKLGKPED
jgi:hypothetical protein